MEKKIRKRLPKKENKLNPSVIVGLGITTIALYFGLEGLYSLITDHFGLGENIFAGTPVPGTQNRKNISTCLDNLGEKYCVAPTTLDKTKDLIAVFTKMIFDKKNLISESSYNILFDSSRNVYDAMESFQNNEPGAIKFFSNTSLFQEASGGSAVQKWDLATVTPNAINPQPVGTPEVVSVNPEEHLYVPQIERDTNGNVIKSLEHLKSGKIKLKL